MFGWLKEIWNAITLKDAREQHREHRRMIRERAEEIFFINYQGKRIHMPRYSGAVDAWPEEPAADVQAACFWIVADEFIHHGMTLQIGSCIVFRRDLDPCWRVRPPQEPSSPSSLLDANLWACEICYGKDTS